MKNILLEKQVAPTDFLAPEKIRQPGITTMRYYPLALDITGEKCLVVGAGAVAWQKIQKLQRYGANVAVVAREVLSPLVAEQIAAGKITYLGREYDKEYLENAMLVMAATDDSSLNAQIRQDADELKVLANTADDRNNCRFLSTAVIEDDELQISIATHGRSSLRSRRTRQFLERNFATIAQTPLRIGSRGSPLAMAQISEFLREFPRQKFLVQTFQTAGDRDKKSPIEKVTFFDTLEAALQNNEIDIALHSAKDIDDEVAPGLEIFALSDSIHPLDALVAKQNGMTLKTLPTGARIGVSGKRRQDQLRIHRPDLELIPIRGNIDERLRLLETQNLDGIIIAMAALIRLGLDFLAAEVLSAEIMPPNPLQGKLALEIRANDEMAKKILAPLIEQSPTFYRI